MRRMSLLRAINYMQRRRMILGVFFTLIHSLAGVWSKAIVVSPKGQKVPIDPRGHTQARLDCSVSDYYFLTWLVQTPDHGVMDIEVPGNAYWLNTRGIKRQDSERMSHLVINGSMDNNGTSVYCKAISFSESPAEVVSRVVKVIFYEDTMRPIVTQRRQYTGDCTYSNLVSELGRRDDLSQTGMVKYALSKSVKDTAPSVQIINHTIVCQSVGTKRNTISSVSMVVHYACMQSSGKICPQALESRTEQFNFECLNRDNGHSSFYPSASIGEMRTMLHDRHPPRKPSESPCGQCYNPLSVRSKLDDADPDTHCVFCHEDCDEGQKKCLGPEKRHCCNWYFNDVCHITCPGKLVGDPTTFDCGCEPLTLYHGNIKLTSAFKLGSVATLKCAEGYELLDSAGNMPTSNVRTCTMDGWTGVPLSCGRLECPALFQIPNGRIRYSPPGCTVSATCKATYECEPGYLLKPSSKPQSRKATRTCKVNQDLTGAYWTGPALKCAFDSIVLFRTKFDLKPSATLSPGEIAGLAITGCMTFISTVLLIIIIIVVVLKRLTT